MEKWYDGLPVLDRNKLSKNKGINDILVKDLKENEIVLAKATINKSFIYFTFLLVLISFIGSIKIYEMDNNQTSFGFYFAMSGAVIGVIRIITLSLTFLLITNERFIGDLVESKNFINLNTEKIIIPLNKIDNLIYEESSINVTSNSKKYILYASNKDIELVRKTYYAYTQFKEKNETKGTELDPKVNPPSTVSDGNKYDEIEKLSELLGKGIVTQEEFDKKKRELLGL